MKLGRTAGPSCTRRSLAGNPWTRLANTANLPKPQICDWKSAGVEPVRGSLGHQRLQDACHRGLRSTLDPLHAEPAFELANLEAHRGVSGLGAARELRSTAAIARKRPQGRKALGGLSHPLDRACC